MAIQLHGATNLTGIPQAPTDRGYIAWNMPLYGAVNAAALAPAGTLFFSRIRRVPAGTITNLVVMCSTAGSTLTSGQCFGALYTAAGALAGQTVDQATAWASTGVKVMALATPYVAATGDYYVTFWYNGTTGPTFTRFVPTGGTSAITNAGLAAPNFIAGIADTGLTTTAPATMGTQTGTGTQYWVALS